MGALAGLLLFIILAAMFRNIWKVIGCLFLVVIVAYSLPALIALYIGYYIYNYPH